MSTSLSHTILAVILVGTLSAGPALALPQGGQAQFNPNKSPNLNAPKPGKQFSNLNLGKPNLPPVGKPLQGGPAKVPGFGGGYGPSKAPNGWAMAGAGIGLAVGAATAGAAIARTVEEADGDCYVIKRRYVDEYGNVIIRRIHRCD